MRGRFRLTEQGEIIAARYSNRDLAHRHLEQIVSAVLLASAPAALQRRATCRNGAAAMERLLDGRLAGLP